MVIYFYIATEIEYGYALMTDKALKICKVSLHLMKVFKLLCTYLVDE